MSFNTPLHFDAPSPSLVWGVLGTVTGGYALVWSLATRKSARILSLRSRLKWSLGTAIAAFVVGWLFCGTAPYRLLTELFRELLVGLVFLGVLMLTPAAVVILGVLGLSLAIPFFISKLPLVRTFIYPLHLATWAYAWFCLAVNMALRG